MVNLVTSLLRKMCSKARASSDSGTAPPPPPPPPFLPAQREHNLTPSPSRESLVTQAVANYGLFQRLPPELRRAILIEAFGGQVVHLDLAFDHPPLVEPDMEERVLVHCGRSVDYRGPGWKTDESKPKAWRWSSSVCHRQHPMQTAPNHWTSPPLDPCRHGRSLLTFCQEWPGEAPGKCFIGAMGWLLSCRQAYVDGMDVLYSTNAMHSESKDIIPSLPRLIPPHRLLQVKRVELLWDFPRVPDARNWPRPTPEMAKFLIFLETLPSVFPGAVSFFIAMQGNVFHHYPRQSTIDDGHETMRDLLLEPVDEAVRKLGTHIQEFVISIHSIIYRERRDQARLKGLPVEQNYRGQLERHWRPVEQPTNLPGYWVALGENPILLPLACSMGTGFPDLGPKEDKIIDGYFS